jgi:diamine N-acetyltransferase
VVELREISTENFEECISLSLTEEQRKFMAPNAYSLAEAYALQNEGKYAPLPYAIYSGETMVGFIMAVYQPKDADDPEDETVFYLSRMMIDRRYQGKGHGKKALSKMIQILKSFCSSADAVVLSCSRENAAAYKLYRSFGFKDTGEYDDAGDVYCRLDLK